MKNTVKYVCSNCGFESSKWMGRCPDCKNWNTFEEQQFSSTGIKKSRTTGEIKIQTLSEVKMEKEFRFPTGIAELDRVLGGGVVRGSSVLIGGEPGIGKSTLMLQTLSKVSQDYKVLYVSGEESASQIKQRAIRLDSNLDKINIFCNVKLEDILLVMEKVKPTLLVVDSLQTVGSREILSPPGSISQIRACSIEIINLAKKIGSAVFLVGHVTKEGQLAGPKVIEHLVDTVLYFDQAASGLRLIRANKNRFGSIDEIGIFLMTVKGLETVTDPSLLFVSERSGATLPPGISFATICEGSRTFMVEIQALVVESKSGYTRVYSDKIENGKVSRIAAVLEKHAGFKFSNKDIYVNIAGGMKVNDVSVELALALALVSAQTGKNLNLRLFSFGEISLAGEIRPVGFSERRLKTGVEMGFKTALSPSSIKKTSKLNQIKVSSINQAIKESFLIN
ncbi:MAG: DNA repair protein RadA [Sphaerochaetaceae bacterium]